MDAKKDIYNLWVKYTTKNEEEYFRQFISGFVAIWKSQLQIDFANPPNWSDIKPDSGPHLSRLPDELLPAIGKFLIIARDLVERDELTNEKLTETTMLIDCLIIICRHFDNIAVVLKYDYITNIIAILSKIFEKIEDAASMEQSEFFRKLSNFIEIIYDPYLTWRCYLQGSFPDYSKLAYKPNPIHVEIVPFFYDCFQSSKIYDMETIGTCLVYALGSLIAGSQRNGMRAICPATVSVIINVVSKWECCQKLREAAVQCYILMIIVLQRSSPEERQIELVTVIQLYCDAILDLLKTEHFCKDITQQDNFEISNESPGSIVDVGALPTTIDAVKELIAEPESAKFICAALLETNLVDILLSIPQRIEKWTIDQQKLSVSVITALCSITRISEKLTNTLRHQETIKQLFGGLKQCGKPSDKLLEACLSLAYDQQIERTYVPEVVSQLLEWLPEMSEREQNYLSTALLKAYSKNYICKSLAREQQLIRTICQCLSQYSNLSATCVQNLIKLTEELAKYSITPMELKSILSLLREQSDFPQEKQLFQTLVTVALSNINTGSTCSEFLDIQNDLDGIIVPDIRNWLASGSYGFIFHILLKMDKPSGNTPKEMQGKNSRRMLFTLMTNQNTGFEIFVTETGTLVAAALTKREFVTSSVTSKTLIDERWHFVTVSLTPPKRPFSYSQINVYVDFLQKMSVTLKVAAFNEPFSYCAIGSAFQIPKAQAHVIPQKFTHSTSQDNGTKGMIPSLIEKSFFPQIVSHVPNYFTLPLRNTSSHDPNVKHFPIGMQNSVFGEQVPLRGQIGAVLLAEPITSLKLIFDGGPDFASIFSQDSEILELNSKFVFCYSAAAYSDGVCIDLVPGGKFNGSVFAKYCKTVKIQETINTIGGIDALLPILSKISKANNGFELVSEMESFGDETGNTPSQEELSDWEILSCSSYTEWKMIQHPVASFLCLIRYLIHDREQNQENLLKSDCLSIVGLMLAKCSPRTFDVHALMATHLLTESIQNQKPTANMNLLESLYNEIIFNFKIWSRMQFQIALGHVQYLSTMIKDDRKYFRKKFGVQFFLDTIRQYYYSPESISFDDAKTIRSTLLSIIRFYLQKDVNIKEINFIITFLASVKHEHIIIELIEMLLTYLKGKHCKDQMFLLLHEPHTTDLLYNFFVDKSYTTRVQDKIMKFIDCLFKSTRISQRHKDTLRLQDHTIECQTLYPGFLSHLTISEMGVTTVTLLIDQILTPEVDYCGLLFLVHHMSLCDVPTKLAIAKKLLTMTFIKNGSASIIAKQIGWQESISRLLIKKPITNAEVEGNCTDLRITLKDALLEDNSEFLSQSDLISFTENELELGSQGELKDSALILNELQASVTEAANVIESEIKELAGSVTGVVAENIANVYSVIRQRTHEIQDTFESLALGGATGTESVLTRSRTSSNSSDEGSSTQSTSLKQTSKKSDSSSIFDFAQDVDVDVEEQLVYLVTNTLFTIMWRGVSNGSVESWKERGQVLACINLLGLNNELVTSHLTLRLRLLEMGVQAALIDLTENHNLKTQENASQILRLVYDLVVLDPNEDECKKCSTKLLDGVLALLDALMIFQQTASDDWSDMIRLCLGLLLKCFHNPNTGIVAMATAKLHAILQNRDIHETSEMAYLLYSINKALSNAVEVGSPEQYSFLMPVVKALLYKCRNLFNLASNAPDLPATSSGPVFFNDFQMYSTSKQWTTFIEKKVKPLHDGYQNEIAANLWEPLNTFWAECYEACKTASQKRINLQMESRRRFQQKIIVPWKMRQVEEMTRLNSTSLQVKTRENLTKRKWKSAKRFLYGPRGPWFLGKRNEEFWKLSQHENLARMRLKLEPQLYPNTHTNAASLRDNTTSSGDAKQQISEDFNSTIKSAVVRDFLSDDENLWIEEEIRNSSEPQHVDMPLEKAVISQECELITLMTKVKGRLEVNQTLLTFADLSPAREDGVKHDFRFQINKIREVHLRKYNLRRSALEIFLTDQTSYFLNFTTKTRNKVFTKILGLQPPNILYGSGRSPSEVLKSSGLTMKWVTREISNFEYLMYLNTIAGRSYNDLSQYPVFPWILADYTSDVLDLTDPKSFRDLSKPIGVINPKNEGEVRAKYDGFEDPSGTIPKFHYGTHYSNSAGVLHYLLRVEPFTSLHIDLQSGRFDVADRQFHSIPQTWKLLMDNPNDVKELIPEFFYFPEFLKNMNKFDLGTLQITKEKVDDVILPTWANTPEEFVAIHRRALESEYVSHHLHQWIDLIFGYKQKGPKAVEALNVFYYCSYEGAVDLDKITNPVEREAVEGMINNFGQTPSQLLREPHPRRLTQEETIVKLLRFELKRPDITQFLDRTVNVSCELSSPKDPIIFISVPRSPPRSFLQISPDVLVSISKSGILGCNSWFSFDKEKGFVLEVDATTTNLKNRRRLFGPFHPEVSINPQLFAVSLDGKFLYCGGVWDNSLRVFGLHKGKMIASVTRHLDIITCIALDNCGSYLVTGSKDCTCIVWSISGAATSNPSYIATQHQTPQINTTNSLTPVPVTTLFGHDDAISCVAIYTELDMVVSGSLDGTVNVYTIKEGQYIRTLKPVGCTEFCVQISFLTISYQGHIAFSALDDRSHSVHVSSVNGTNLGSKYVSGRVTGLTTASDFLIVADDAGDITLSRLHGLKPVFDIPLHVPIQTVVVTPGNTHLLAPLRDGRLAIIGVSLPTTYRKHSVLNV